MSCLFLPEGYKDCPKRGDILAGKFLPFKTPLDKKFFPQLSYDERFTPETFISSLAKNKIELELWIDLTNTKKYYHPRSVRMEGVKYVKFPIQGHKLPPSIRDTRDFVDLCYKFFKNNPNSIIGVHCTHGFNRTGFLICSYLIERLNYPVKLAVKEFSRIRPPGIYKDYYIKELYRRYGKVEDFKFYPSTPEWLLSDDSLRSRKKIKKMNDGYYNYFLTDRKPNNQTDYLNNDYIGKKLGQSSSRMDDEEINCFYINNQPEQLNNQMSDNLNAVKIDKNPDQSRNRIDNQSTNRYYIDKQPSKIKSNNVMNDNLVYDYSHKKPFQIRSSNHNLIPRSQFANIDPDLVHKPRFTINNPQLIVEEQKYIGEIIGFDLIDDLNESDRIIKKILKLGKFESNNFPGSKPNFINQQNLNYIQHIPYQIRLVGKGSRFMMLIERKNQVYLLDQDNRVFKINEKSCPKFPKKNQPDQHLTDTLLDGEMKIELIVNKKYDLTYMICDIVTLDAQDIGSKIFDERIKFIAEDLIEPREMAKKSSDIKSSEELFKICKKEFFDLIDLNKFFNDRLKCHYEHEIKGLIFQPENEHYKTDKILKWLPPKANSINFRMRIIKPEKKFVRNFRELCGSLQVGRENKEFGRIRIIGEALDYDNKIVECVFDSRIDEWKLLRLRNDQQSPVDYDTCSLIFNTIKNPVTRRNLLDAVDKFESKIKIMGFSR